ncbi:dihydrofolate reductase [Arthrobacter pullicola]|nr:dihydrofolate reductase [Arthrobacter pullicola]
MTEKNNSTDSTRYYPAGDPGKPGLDLDEALAARGFGTSGVPLVGMIWAQTGDGVIGRDGGMPWHLPEDLAHFKATTQGHPVIMGRRTWESFPEAFRPLPNRTNIVISSRPGLAAELGSQGAAVVSSLEAALEAAEGSEGSSRIWIVGGSQLYAAAEPLADVAIVTVINTETEGDSYAPRLGPDWTFTAVSPAQDWYTSTNGLQYRIALWTRNRGVTDQDSSQPLA